MTFVCDMDPGSGLVTLAQIMQSTMVKALLFYQKQKLWVHEQNIPSPAKQNLNSNQNDCTINGRLTSVKISFRY